MSRPVCLLGTELVFFPATLALFLLAFENLFFFAHKIAGNRSLPAFSPFAQMYYIDHLTWDTMFRTALFETSEISPRVNHNHSYFPLSINVHPSWVTEKEGKELASLPPHSRVSEGFKRTDFLECLHIVYTPFIPWLISHYLQKMFMKIERPGFMLSHLSFVTLASFLFIPLFTFQPVVILYFWDKASVCYLGWLFYYEFKWSSVLSFSSIGSYVCEPICLALSSY